MKFLKNFSSQMIASILLSFVVFSCAKSDDSSSSKNTTVYATSCINDTADNDSKKRYVTFSGNSYEKRTEYYDALNCIDKAYIWADNYVYQEEGYKTTYSGERTNKVDLTYSSKKLTPKNTKAVQWYNQNEYCGYTDWFVDEEKDLTGLSCGSSTFYNAGKKLITNWYIYSDGQFFKFGDYSDSASADSYGYANYLQNTVYQKQ